MRFRVFVREHHDGSATVHALEAPHVFAYAGSPKAEVARMTKVLAEFVVSISRGYQGNFVFREDQELRRLDVDVKPRGKVEEEVPISVRNCLKSLTSGPTASPSGGSSPRR